MKPLMKRIIMLVALFITAVLSLLWLNKVIHLSYQLPDGIMISAKWGVNISFKDCDSPEMQANISGIVTADALVNSDIDPKGLSVPVKLNYTNDNYSEIVPFKFLSGGYFAQNSIHEANHYVVISNLLSVKLFKTYNSVGQQLIINDEKYTICGVYEQPSSILSKISSDGLEQVYLSYSNLIDYEKAVIQNFYIVNYGSIFEANVISNAQLPTSQAVQYQSSVNFSDIKKVIVQTKSVVWFLLGMLIIGYTASIFVKKLKMIHSIISTVKSGKKQLIIWMVQLFGCLALISGVWFLVKFPLFIPNKILPPDNIFDIAYYTESIISITQMQNQLGVYNYYWDYAAVLAVNSLLAGMLSITAVVAVLCLGISTIKNREHY